MSGRENEVLSVLSQKREEMKVENERLEMLL